jgi:gamma-glutamylcyclotransferase (GGCT)/AIG2-like uncharacterized protein YtfP
LRKNGSANHFLQNANLLKQNFKLPGFALYDCGSFPKAIESNDSANYIIGDIYEIESRYLYAIDAYEGEEYFRQHIPQINSQIYLAVNKISVKKLPLVHHGDWLSYFKNRNR